MMSESERAARFFYGVATAGGLFLIVAIMTIVLYYT